MDGYFTLAFGQHKDRGNKGLDSGNKDTATTTADVEAKC